MPKLLFSIWRYYYFLLLPLFFVLHVNNHYFGLIHPAIVATRWLAYSALTAAIYLLVLLIYKNRGKAAAFTSIFLVIFFGFGATKTFLATIPVIAAMAAYRYFLPLVLLALLLLFFYFKRRSSPLPRFTRFASLTIVVVTVLELAKLSMNTVTHAARKNDLGDPDNSIAAAFRPCAGCTTPDIYFLIFDEFTSSDCLKKNFGYSNDTLDSYLYKNHFFVSRSSQSNYSFTTFSIPATVDMQYLRLPPGYTDARAEDLSRGEYSFFNNNTFKVLEKQGYSIHNYSFFDAKDHPAAFGEYFKDLQGAYFDVETLYGRVKKDIGSFFTHPFSSSSPQEDSLLKRDYYMSRSNYLQNTIRMANAGIGGQDHSKKNFFFIHIMLPHDPYIYNADGSLGGYHHPDSLKGYLEQVKYAGKVLVNMIDGIQKASAGKAVIIAQGDHGFKGWRGNGNYESKAFQNLNAIYFPDSTYTGFYDGVSPVNTFRLVFNHYFHTNLPLLKDESKQVFFRSGKNLF